MYFSSNFNHFLPQDSYLPGSVRCFRMASLAISWLKREERWCLCCCLWSFGVVRWWEHPYLSSTSGANGWCLVSIKNYWTNLYFALNLAIEYLHFSFLPRCSSSTNYLAIKKCSIAWSLVEHSKLHSNSTPSNVAFITRAQPSYSYQKCWSLLVIDQVAINFEFMGLNFGAGLVK